MRRLAFTAAVALLVSSGAAAQTVSTHCIRHGKQLFCQTNYGPQAGAFGIIAVPPDPNAAAREAKWAAYCNPQLGPPDAHGVRRYTYAKPGCENGKSED